MRTADFESAASTNLPAGRQVSPPGQRAAILSFLGQLLIREIDNFYLQQLFLGMNTFRRIIIIFFIMLIEWNASCKL